MIYVFKLVGTAGFYLLWPVWFVYFRLNPIRTRALIISEGEVVLVKGWLGKNDWNLPGGGVKKGESFENALKREIKEEVDLILDPDKFSQFGTRINNQHKLKYTAHFYVYHLNRRAELKIGFPEIVDAKWININNIGAYKLSKEAKFALKKHVRSA